VATIKRRPFKYSSAIAAIMFFDIAGDQQKERRRVDKGIAEDRL